MTVQKKVREIIDSSKRIVFFGGAGVSTASGIPDFRSANGLYKEDDGKGLSPEMILSRSFFYLHPEAFFDFYRKHMLYRNIRVYELHGNVHENYCMECNASYPMETILRSEGIPRCECGGVIKPNVVLYGEPLEKYVCIGARREISNADTLIVAGTSLAVEPAASMIADFRGKHLIVINQEPTPADDAAEILIRDDVAEVFEKLACP